VSLSRDFESEMKRLPLDVSTADRLLAGAIGPEDAPPSYAVVANFVTELADTTSSNVDREEEVVAALAVAVRSSQTETSTRRRRSGVPRLKLAAAFAVVALAGTTSLAVAGSLPGAAQDIASTMLAKVGVSVPGPNENAGEHPNVRGQSGGAAVEPASSGKGGQISDLATTTDLTGVEKGAAISSVASGGKSHAGHNGQASTHSAPVPTPNPGGTGTADTASGGNSATGTATANTASDGHSAEGSANSATGQSHRP
jgi:hypothetical protein